MRDMVEIKRATQDFLLYSYFELDSEELSNIEHVRKKCIDRAYLDLARRVPYSTSTSNLAGLEKEQQKALERGKKAFYDAMSGLLLDKVAQLDETVEDFEKWHKGACDALIDCSEKYCPDVLTEKLTYGHAQKWLNMSLKYLWLLGKLDERYTRLLHVPVDSYIIEAVDMAVGGGWMKGKTWSGWNDPSYYARFQDAARKAAGDQAPIVWEGSAWIGIAKKRK